MQAANGIHTCVPWGTSSRNKLKLVPTTALNAFFLAVLSNTKTGDFWGRVTWTPLRSASIRTLRSPPLDQRATASLEPDPVADWHGTARSTTACGPWGPLPCIVATGTELGCPLERRKIPQFLGDPVEWIKIVHHSFTIISVIQEVNVCILFLNSFMNIDLRLAKERRELPEMFPEAHYPFSAFTWARSSLASRCFSQTHLEHFLGTDTPPPDAEEKVKALQLTAEEAKRLSQDCPGILCPLLLGLWYLFCISRSEPQKMKAIAHLMSFYHFQFQRVESKLWLQKCMVKLSGWIQGTTIPASAWMWAYTSAGIPCIWLWRARQLWKLVKSTSSTMETWGCCQSDFASLWLVFGQFWWWI